MSKLLVGLRESSRTRHESSPYISSAPILGIFSVASIFCPTANKPWPESCFGAENSDRNVQNVVTDSTAEYVEGSRDESGYAVPMTRYSRGEIGKLLDFTNKVSRERNLGQPKTFCAGFYANSLDLQKEIASHGYTTSGAAFPPGTRFGSKYAPTWHKLSGWDASVTYKSRPYRISRRSILPRSQAPFIIAADGQPLLEVPQTYKIDWMVTAEDMKVIFKEHLAIAQRGTTTAVCLAIHETSGAEHFTKYDEVLRYVDESLHQRANRP